ncbi:conserved mitochondrial DUF647 domain-containing protein [Andalucia godoyi]|uniref:Conserved mitochondrial DUF647 domain-containing protein n=1 Tax=Andalucia godoyi TaxID=505711 RepID=A0A8K0AHA1_ANDGO|nr:conserved mitochondrial DUF647 domain-containing protein [Andalucia godoyi]|eukprot:ANDGO_08054.mRNA.1 conserved mitochondrial DUF647 domain-containing protein
MSFARFVSSSVPPRLGGAGAVVRQTVRNGSVVSIRQGNPSSMRIEASKRDSLVRRTISMFMPDRYPHSVDSSYARFSLLQGIQHFSNSITSVMSTQSLLLALGLGSGALPIAATLNWILKDGLGQLGGIVFSSRMGTMFDLHTKTLYIASSIFFQMACLLEYMCPFAGPYLFLPLASVANVGKNLAWISASASKVKMHQSLSTDDKGSNLGDLTAKSGSQATAFSMIGIGFSVILTSYFGNHPVTNMTLGLLFAACSVGAAVAGAVTVPMRNVTEPRLLHLFEIFSKTGTVPDPSSLRKEDVLVELAFIKKRIQGRFVKINPDLRRIHEFNLDGLWNVATETSKKTIFVAEENAFLVRTDASPHDVFRGYCTDVLRQSEAEFGHFVEAMTKQGWDVKNSDLEGSRTSQRFEVDPASAQSEIEEDAEFDSTTSMNR